MIAARDLTFAYGGHPPTFAGLDFEVRRGEIWSVVGPSGCGKTTLLYLLAGLLFPSSGTVTVDDRPLERPRPETGLVLQDHGLLPWATVRENARLGLDIRRFYGADGRHTPADAVLDPVTEDRRVFHWLRRLGIGHLAESFPARLSRGQRQRTAIARTLILGPDLLLLDEPFSALDAPTREDLQQLVVALNRDADLTCVMVTHDIEEAVTMGEKILALTGSVNENNRIIDNPHALKSMGRNIDGVRTLCLDLRRLLGRLL